MLFVLSINFTDQGIRNIKDGPKRARAARELATKLGANLREVYITTGENDLVAFLEAPNGDVALKFALALGSQGNVRTKTARAWSMDEYAKLLDELP
jgi:uncharacterized protein with GYD domain